MQCKWLGIVITLGCAVAGPSQAAQPSSDTGRTPLDVTDEVLVRGTRLRELKAAIVEAEDRFYARYNELNKVDKFDVECMQDAHTGTKLKQRRCFAKLQLEAKSLNGIETLQMRQEQEGPTPHPGRPPNTNPEGIWLAHYDEYRENMLYLLKMNPDLRRLAREGEDAQKRYDREHKRRLKGRLILIE